MSSLFMRAVAALALVPAVAVAQATPAGRIALSGSTIRPGVAKYAIRAISGGHSRDIGTRTVTVTSGSRDGKPAWVITEVQTTPGMTATDSVFVAKSDLAGLHRVARYDGQQGVNTMTMQFAPDSIRAAVVNGGQRQAMALPKKAGSAATWAVVEVLLRSRPLGAKWRGTIDVVATQPSGVTPVELTVTGSTTVATPAGSFSSWVLSAKSPDGSNHTHYIAKTGLIVKSVMTPPQMNGGSLETVLISTSAP